MTGFTPAPAGDLIENPETRKKVYRTVQFAGLGLAVATAGLAAFGVTPETFPYLLSAWSVFGVLNAWASNLAVKNTPA